MTKKGIAIIPALFTKDRSGVLSTGLLSVGALTWWLVPNYTAAHCPLCTAGAGALAVAAAYWGVEYAVVGVVIGAFGVVLGMWFSKMIKTQYLPAQELVVTLGIFLATVVPVMPLIRAYAPLDISIAGEYGSLLHNTYTINLFLLGSVIGGLAALIAPRLSKFIKQKRGRSFPFQTTIVTLVVIAVSALVVQLGS